MFNSEKYAVATMVSIKDMKNAGYTVGVGKTSKGYQVAEFRKGNDKPFLAVCAKEFVGTVNDNTNIVEGENAEGEPRLYLTNKTGITFTAI